MIIDWPNILLFKLRLLPAGGRVLRPRRWHPAKCR